LMPDFDFDAFNHEYDEDGHEGGSSFEAPSAPASPEAPSASQADNGASEEVDKW